MKRTITVILVVLIILGTTGCWDLQELNEIGLVQLIGIDYDPKGDGFEVTVHVHVPLPNGNQEGGGDSIQQTTWVTSASGQTVVDAFRNLRGRAGFQLSFHHARIIIVGEDLARKGVKPVLDHILRTRELRLNALFMVCHGTAKDILQVKPEVAESLSQEIEGILSNEEVWSKSHSIEVYRFVQNLLNPGTHPVASHLFTIKPEVMPPSEDQEEGSSSVKETLVIEGLAVFNDDKLVDWLTGTETIGFRYITSKAGEMILVVPWHGGLTSVEVNMISCSKTAIYNDGIPTMKVKIFLSGTLLEYTGYINLNDVEIMTELENLIADQVANILQSTDKKAKNLGVDFLDYGGVISRNHPQHWNKLNKKWREIFPTIDTVFDIRLNLVHPGVIVEPIPR